MVSVLSDMSGRMKCAYCYCVAFATKSTANQSCHKMVLTIYRPEKDFNDFRTLKASRICSGINSSYAFTSILSRDSYRIPHRN